MPAWDVSRLRLRYERLFESRVVRCCAHRPSSLTAMLKEAIERAGDQEALVDGDRRLTWDALGTMVEEVATSLSRKGVQPGDRVAIMIGNRAEFVVLLHAVARIGGVLVPISTREQAPSISYILNHSGAKLLFHESDLAEQLPHRSDVAGTDEFISIPATRSADILHDLRGSGAAPSVTIAEENAAAILYTSGTTGRPKGAVIAHVNLVHAALIYEHTMELGAADRSIAVVPLSHVTGLSALIALMLRCAGTLIIAPAFKAPDFLALATRERMTHTVLVPAMYNLCLARADFSAHDLTRWRVGAYGGAPMPAPTIERLGQVLPELRLMNLYGSTETVLPQAIMPPHFAFSRREAVGLTSPGGDVLVMDESGRECTRGEVGELWLRSATVVHGYWNDPQATAASFVSGFWRSGDLGRMDGEGFIYVLDRIKDMINRGGYKIYSAEVENVLAEHPGVLECAVVAKPCPVLGERVHAFVARRDPALQSEELARFCAPRLADYKRPESFTLSDAPLPRNANGKLLKREMRTTLASNSDRGALA